MRGGLFQVLQSKLLHCWVLRQQRCNVQEIKCNVHVHLSPAPSQPLLPFHVRDDGNTSLCLSTPHPEIYGNHFSSLQEYGRSGALSPRGSHSVNRWALRELFLVPAHSQGSTTCETKHITTKRHRRTFQPAGSVPSSKNPEQKQEETRKWLLNISLGLP